MVHYTPEWLGAAPRAKLKHTWELATPEKAFTRKDILGHQASDRSILGAPEAPPLSTLSSKAPPLEPSLSVQAPQPSSPEIREGEVPQGRGPGSKDAVPSSPFSPLPPTVIAALPPLCGDRSWCPRRQTFSSDRGHHLGSRRRTPKERAGSPHLFGPGPGPPVPRRQELLSAPTAPPPPPTKSPTSPGSGPTRGWLRETSGGASQRATPPKARSWSTLFRSPAQTRLSRSASGLRMVPPPPGCGRSLPRCTPGTAYLHFSEASGSWTPQPPSRTALWDLESASHAFSPLLTQSPGTPRENLNVKHRPPSWNVGAAGIRALVPASVGWGMVSPSSRRRCCWLCTSWRDPASDGIGTARGQSGWAWRRGSFGWVWELVARPGVGG